TRAYDGTLYACNRVCNFMDFPIATLWIFVLQLSPFFACNKYTRTPDLLLFYEFLDHLRFKKHQECKV
ncbi:MAG: hypothetical protein KBG13_07440, partial [Syntrophaceae bacterium]|nr:hypothetical protein [Syntrophaceae bacterium]